MTQESPFAAAVRKELAAARNGHEPIHSDHEAFAVIYEEVEEYWAEVMKKRSERRPERLVEELIQIAAMCQRAAEDLNLDRQLVRPATAPAA